jgi:GNAT superfamily N-acetyltransferase
MNIRPYTNDDWPRVCEIHDAARRDELSAAGLADAFLTLAETAEIEGFFDYRLLVAEIAGEVQGFAAFSDSELSWLYVEPGSYRKGIGSALVQAALRATGAPLTVEVLDGNEAALAVYRKAGFVAVGHASGRMPGNETYAVSVTELRYAGWPESSVG